MLLGKKDILREYSHYFRKKNLVTSTQFVCLFHFKDITGWGENDRGVSFTFGGDIVKEYLKRFNCSLIARAHQVVEDGYAFFEKRKVRCLVCYIYFQFLFLIHNALSLALIFGFFTIESRNRLVKRKLYYVLHCVCMRGCLEGLDSNVYWCYFFLLINNTTSVKSSVL